MLGLGGVLRRFSLFILFGLLSRLCLLGHPGHLVGGRFDLGRLPRLGLVDGRTRLGRHRLDVGAGLGGVGDFFGFRLLVVIAQVEEHGAVEFVDSLGRVGVEARVGFDGGREPVPRLLLEALGEQGVGVGVEQAP